MAYKVIISNEVVKNLDAIIFYLEQNWSKAIAEKFLISFYKSVDSISKNPKLSKKSSKHSSIRKILITKHNILYYEVHNERIELLQIFDTRQNPVKNKFE